MTVLYPNPTLVDALAPAALLHEGISLAQGFEYHLAKSIKLMPTDMRRADHHLRQARRLADLAATVPLRKDPHALLPPFQHR